MKKFISFNLVIIMALSIIIFSCKKDDDQDEPIVSSGIYEGSFINPTIEERQDFLLGGYHTIQGDLEFSQLVELVDFSEFTNLKEITGSLVINQNSYLQSFEGLENLETIGGDFNFTGLLSGTPSLYRITSLEKLTSVGGDLIVQNSVLVSDISGFNNVVFVGGDLKLINLMNVVNVSFSSLNSVGGDFHLYNMTNIRYLMGITNLRNIGGDFIISNSAKSKGNRLNSLEGINDLSSVGGKLEVSHNTMLNNFCSLDHLLQSGGLAGELIIEANFYNPTIEQILGEECQAEEVFPYLDGYYIRGQGTAIINYESFGMMTIAKNEVTQESRRELLELFVAVKAGEEGFNIYKAENNEIIVYGPGDDFSVVTEPDPNEPSVDFWSGTLTPSNVKFTVDHDGLYHIIIDTEINKVMVVPVDYWGIIGSATPGGWGVDTPLPSEGFGLQTITFSTENIILSADDYKLRYSGGWKVILDPDFDLGNGELGIKVNTSLGGSLQNLEFGGNNLSNEIDGIYKIWVKWQLGDGFTADLIKTADTPPEDYSDTELGLVGDGIMIDGNQHDWGLSVYLHTPIVTNETTYTWNFNQVEITTAGSFKIREGNNWNNLIFGYPDVIMGGNSADVFDENGDGNFVPLVNGVYDLEFIINQATQTYYLNVN
ncbi:MAG: hypothetical protein GQ527_10410 [Bacteroidales bacterium]|nr:hypothetical protein [Bacteroidales bacterium]